MALRFRDRVHAGRELAARLTHHRGEDAIVLALPRGGVPVAFEVARSLALPLDIVVVRKLGAPGHAELGMGAVAEGGAMFFDPDIAAEVGATLEDVEDIVARERNEVDRRVRAWRGARPPPALAGRTAIVVDDGIATGGTMHAALRFLRGRHPKRLILAVPVAATPSLEDLAPEVDEVVCVASVPHLGSVGAWYEDFSQVDDSEVAALLAEAHHALDPPATSDAADAR